MSNSLDLDVSPSYLASHPGKSCLHMPLRSRLGNLWLKNSRSSSAKRFENFPFIIDSLSEEMASLKYNLGLQISTDLLGKLTPRSELGFE